MIADKMKKYISFSGFFTLFAPLILVNTIISLVIISPLMKSGCQGNNFHAFFEIDSLSRQKQNSL